MTSYSFNKLLKNTATSERMSVTDGISDLSSNQKNIKVTSLDPVSTKLAERLQLSSYSNIYQLFTENKNLQVGDVLIIDEKRYIIKEMMSFDFDGSTCSQLVVEKVVE